MRHLLPAFAAVTASLGIALAAAEPSVTPQKRPNIVLIIADDLGSEDSGPYGCQGVRTPGLDRMAKEGMKFTEAFNTCSSCSPSRCSIITGRYPHNTGAERLHMPLPKERITFVEKLREAGYWTAQAGKWHLGPFVEDRFDLVLQNFVEKGIRADGSGCEMWESVLKGRPKDKPFFLWLAAHDPHRPWAEDTLASPHKPEDAKVPPFLPDGLPTRQELASYYDEISRLDSYVGNFMEALKREGLQDDTVVFFITDNGRPFPRCKTSVYDSGIQSPLLVCWPGRVAPGSECASLVSSVDLAPTILELAGLTSPSEFQGRSFARLLEKPEETIREKVFAEHNWHDFAACERAVRTKQFKYIRNFWPDLPGTPPIDAARGKTYEEMRRLRDAGQLPPEQMGCFLAPRPAEELYDVQADPQELKNLAEDPKYADTLKDLRVQLDVWRTETKDFVPDPRPQDSVDRETAQKKPGGQKKSTSTHP